MMEVCDVISVATEFMVGKGNVSACLKWFSIMPRAKSAPNHDLCHHADDATLLHHA